MFDWETISAVITAKSFTTSIYTALNHPSTDDTFAVMAANIGKITAGLPGFTFTAGGTRVSATCPIPKGYKTLNGSFSSAHTTAAYVTVVYNNVTVYTDSVANASKSFTKTFDGNSTGYINYNYYTSQESDTGQLSVSLA